MHRTLDGDTPTVADSAFVSELSYLVGDVLVDERASLWPFTCLRGDGGSTIVGAEANVQEFTMLHGAVLGDEVTIGHNVVVDYATVEDHSWTSANSTERRATSAELHSRGWCPFTPPSPVSGGTTAK